MPHMPQLSVDGAHIDPTTQSWHSSRPASAAATASVSATASGSRSPSVQAISPHDEGNGGFFGSLEADVQEHIVDLAQDYIEYDYGPEEDDEENDLSSDPPPQRSEGVRSLSHTTAMPRSGGTNDPLTAFVISSPPQEWNRIGEEISEMEINIHGMDQFEVVDKLGEGQFALEANLFLLFC